jgi:F0F1-type ATP synthase assembly protein I
MSTGSDPNQHGEEPKSPKKGSELLPGMGQLYRDFAPYFTMGFQLAAAVLLFFFAGWWIDSRYETAPTFQLLGILIGFAGGLVKFLRTVSDLNKQKQP